MTSEIREILKHVDHTVLRSTSTWREIETCLEETLHYGAASACIPPSYIEAAVNWRKQVPVRERVRICTVVGFPSGYSTSAAKFCEARDAVSKGADEIDIVVNLGWVKDGNWDAIRSELQAIRETTRKVVLKVIIECSELEQAEKIELCKIVSEIGANYIKTSTGFASGGATLEDVQLLREHSDPAVKVKAAGGISSFDDARAMLAAGADRLGTSRLIKILKATEQ